jgi:methylenetetrahydrofolate dehydrogenase (NADP+)/methenyltetrahydrofolate cyclohydrolase
VTAKVLDGRVLAQQIFDDVATKVGARVATGKPRPKLATVIVGDNPASALYVRSKQKNAREVGIDSQDHRLPTETSTEQLVDLIGTLNRDESVSGILVQQPLPMHIDVAHVVIAVDPLKDVDGFHPFNAGLVAQGLPGGIQPCTPTGIIELLEHAGIRIEGANAVVVGRSNIVGKPTALLLIKRNATVTVCHTRTKNLSAHTREADILVTAAGRPNLITKEMVKPGAAVVDVSANRGEAGQVGDLAPGVEEVAGWLTPNPGGVGPMTRAMLVRNTFEAEVRRRP